MLKTKIKASCIRNLTDARYFAARQVDFLGFDLSTLAEERLSLAEIKEIKDWIEGPTFVGEMDLLDISKAREIIDFLSLEIIQAGMFTPMEYLNGLGNLSIIKEVVIEPNTSFLEISKHLEKYFNYTDFFLLDFSKNNITWEQLRKTDALADLSKICQQYQIFLNINFNPSAMTELLEKINLFGLSLQGGDEEKTGYKSFEKLDEIFELLEET